MGASVDVLAAASTAITTPASNGMSERGGTATGSLSNAPDATGASRAGGSAGRSRPDTTLIGSGASGTSSAEAMAAGGATAGGATAGATTATGATTTGAITSGATATGAATTGAATTGTTVGRPSTHKTTPASSLPPSGRPRAAVDNAAPPGRTATAMLAETGLPRVTHAAGKAGTPSPASGRGSLRAGLAQPPAAIAPLGMQTHAGSNENAATATTAGPAAHGGPDAGHVSAPAGPAPMGFNPVSDVGATNVLAPPTPTGAPVQGAPAQQPTPAPPTQLPGVASQLLSVLTPLRAAATGTQSVTILLHPETLGDVRATVTSNAQGVLVRLAASTPEGTAALRSALGDLHSGLSDSAQNAVVLLSDGGSGERHGHSPQHAAPESFAPASAGVLSGPRQAASVSALVRPHLDGARLLDIRI